MWHLHLQNNLFNQIIIFLSKDTAFEVLPIGEPGVSSRYKYRDFG